MTGSKTETMSLDLEPINELHRKIQEKLQSMLKPSEFRIGNNIERRGEVGTVYSINPNDVWVKFGGEYGDTERWYYDDIEAISLTPDILEKCGFVKKPNDDRCLIFEWRYRPTEIPGPIIPICIHLSADDKFCLTNWGHTMILSERFEYVHQLQNPFHSLCGEELIVKL